MQQRYARKHSIPVDEIVFRYEVVEEDTVLEPSDDSVLIHGLYLEGARWDSGKRSLADPNPKELFFSMPNVRK